MEWNSEKFKDLTWWLSIKFFLHIATCLPKWSSEVCQFRIVVHVDENVRQKAVQWYGMVEILCRRSTYEWNLMLSLLFMVQHQRKQVNKELWTEALTYGDIQLLPIVDLYNLITYKTLSICMYVVCELLWFRSMLSRYWVLGHSKQYMNLDWLHSPVNVPFDRCCCIS